MEQVATTNKITVSKTYNLGNYQSARLEMEVSLPQPVPVTDHDALTYYFGQSFAALDSSYNNLFIKKQ